MGFLVLDRSCMTNMHRICLRFGFGDAITEMAALHKQFGLLAEGARLKDTFALLDIAPESEAERKRWFGYLEDHLPTFASDIDGLNGHDRMVKAFRDNLESPHPHPMFSRCHDASEDDARVLVTTERPLAYVPRDHIVISFPTTPDLRVHG